MSCLGWLEKLKEFVKVEIKINAPLIDNSKKALIVNDSSKKSSDNRQVISPATYSDEKQELVLNFAGLSELQKQKLKLVLQDYLDEDNKLLQTETDTLLEKLYQYSKENIDKQVLEFFRPIIPFKDSEALEAALYLRSAFKKHDDVSKLKEDIRDSFGIRGSNIANLCTAGYFEEFLMPLYNASKERFEELYNVIVQNAVLAVFVHQAMKPSDIPIEIEQKIKISRKYGISFIHIHGIGERNVKKIKECIQKQKDFFKFFEKKIFEKENIIIIELLLEPKE